MCLNLVATDNDAGRILGILTRNAVCDACIARQAGLSLERVDEVLPRVIAVLGLTSERGRCHTCLVAATIRRLP